MIALFDFVPTYCPNCGTKLNLGADYLRKASHTCKCGMGFQLAEHEPMIQAAEKSGGDLGNWH